MGEHGKEDDGRFEEARDEINRRRNVARVRDVHMSAREGVFLCMRVSDIMLWPRVEEPTVYIVKL